MTDDTTPRSGPDVPTPPRPDDPIPQRQEDPTPEDAPLAEPRPPLPLPPPPGTAAAPSGDDRRVRSPALAVFLSVAPGLGHLYVGAYQRAVMIVTAFFLSIYLLPLPVSIFIPLFVWFFGLFDAYRLAQLEELSLRPADERSGDHSKGTLAFGVFLAVVGVVILIDNLFGIDLWWLRDWWPAVLVAAGAYFIIEAVRERAADRRRASEAELEQMESDLDL